MEEKKGGKEEDQEKEYFKKKNADRCWDNWLPGVLIYAGTIVKVYPDRAFALLRYLDLIYQAYVDFPGPA